MAGRRQIAMYSPKRFAIRAAISIIAAATALPAAADPTEDNKSIGALKAHRTRDGATVEQVVIGAKKYGFYPHKWWGDADHHEAGLSYADTPRPITDDEAYWESWEVDLKAGVVVPKDDGDNAWLIELGRLPFAYHINQLSADNDRPYDRALVNNVQILSFLPAQEGNLSLAFQRRHLKLRRANIEWVSHKLASNSDGRTTEGYLVWVFFDCSPPPGADPKPYQNEQAGFSEPDGKGGFRPLNPVAQQFVDGGATLCRAPE